MFRGLGNFSGVALKGCVAVAVFSRGSSPLFDSVSWRW